jgi:hypothetical protein
MRMLLTSFSLLAVLAIPAKADRVVTDTERDKLISALTAQGCTGGKMEWDDDDREFEVDNASCNDDRPYDLKFNADFTLKSKKLDD